MEETQHHMLQLILVEKLNIYQLEVEVVQVLQEEVEL
jgi:hypothetical protein